MKYDPTMSHFDLDIERGRNGELFVDDIRKMFAERSGEVEVKTDHRTIDTKRMYIELECCGRDGVWRPSGLNTTKAKLWAIVWGRQNPDRLVPAMFVVDTEWLRRAVKEAERLGNKAECKYGENPTRGVCVYINHFMLTAPP